MAGTIIRTFRYYAQGERVKYLLHGFLSLLLLFTAAIVSNIESVQQTLNITLEAAYVHVFVPVEALIWVRSLAIVLLIVAHALRHVQYMAPQPSALGDASQRSQASLPALSPELVEALRGVLAQVTVMEEVPQELLAPQSKQPPNTVEDEGEQEANNYERVKAFLVRSPGASARTIAQALGMSASTAHKWRGRVMGEQGISE